MRKRFFTEINDDFFFRFKKEQVKEILRNIHKRRVHPGGYTSQGSGWLFPDLKYNFKPSWITHDQ